MLTLRRGTHNPPLSLPRTLSLLVRPHIQIMAAAIDCRWDREFSCAYASPTSWPSASSPRCDCGVAATITRPSRSCCHATDSPSCSANSPRPENVRNLTGPIARSSRCCSVWYPRRAAPDCVCSSPRIPSCAGTATCCRRRWAKKSYPKNGRPATHRNIKTWSCAWPARIRPGGLPADPRRAGRPWHRRRRLHRLGDPHDRRRRACATTRLGDLGELPAVPGAKGSSPPTSSPPISWTARRSTSWPSSSMPPAGSASSAARSIRPASGPRRWPETCSWTSMTPLPR